MINFNLCGLYFQGYLVLKSLSFLLWDEGEGISLQIHMYILPDKCANIEWKLVTFKYI